MNPVSGIVVVAFGCYLIGLAVTTVAKRPLVERFLRSFASSARAHYTEQTLRLVAGAALVMFSPSMRHPDLFRSFGWLMVVTAVGLFLVPWRWHRKFGEWAIPLAIRHIRLFAVGTAALGTFVLYGASRVL